MKPKYSIIVQDLNADQARRLINELDGGDFFIGASMSKKTEEPTTVGFGVQNEPFAATTVPTITTEVPASSLPEIDTTGLPWDERIHASSKAKNKDGSWKQKRGVQPVIVTEVEAELRTAGRVSPAMAAPVAPVMPVMPTMAAPVAPVVPMAPAPVAPPMPQPTPQVATRDFQGLMLRISQLFAAKQIAPEYPNTIIQRVNEGFGVTLATITDVANDPRMVEYSWQCLEVDGKAA